MTSTLIHLHRHSFELTTRERPHLGILKDVVMLRGLLHHRASSLRGCLESILNALQFLQEILRQTITPGPVVITFAFIGYLVAGVAGATAAALGIFLPVHRWLYY